MSAVVLAHCQEVLSAVSVSKPSDVLVFVRVLVRVRVLVAVVVSVPGSWKDVALVHYAHKDRVKWTKFWQFIFQSYQNFAGVEFEKVSTYLG